MKKINIKVPITEIYLWIPWEMVADTVGSAEHTLGTTAIDVFSHRGEVIMFLGVVKIFLHFMTSKNPGYLASRTEFCGTPRQGSLKTRKSAAVPGTPGRMGSIQGCC